MDRGSDHPPANYAHFWDWILWLAGKRAKGDQRLVVHELLKLSSHILQPCGVAEPPVSIELAISQYLDARASLEAKLQVTVARELGDAVRERISASA
jgi:hypothetical protein